MKFQVTISMNCQTLTRCMNVNEQSFVSVYRVHSVSIDSYFICVCVLSFTMECDLVCEGVEGFFFLPENMSLETFHVDRFSKIPPSNLLGYSSLIW
jgi:hypothetical protein